MRDDTLRRLTELAREAERLARQIEREIRTERDGRIDYNQGPRNESVRPEAR